MQRFRRILLVAYKGFVGYNSGFGRVAWLLIGWL